MHAICDIYPAKFEYAIVPYFPVLSQNNTLSTMMVYIVFLSEQNLGRRSTMSLTMTPTRHNNASNLWKEMPYQEVRHKNGHGFIIDKYMYAKDMSTQKGVMYLRCQTPKRWKCKGRAVISNKKVKITRWHNHEPPDFTGVNFQLVESETPTSPIQLIGDFNPDVEASSAPDAFQNVEKEPDMFIDSGGQQLVFDDAGASGQVQDQSGQVQDQTGQVQDQSGQVQDQSGQEINPELAFDQGGSDMVLDSGPQIVLDHVDPEILLHIDKSNQPEDLPPKTFVINLWWGSDF